MISVLPKPLMVPLGTLSGNLQRVCRRYAPGYSLSGWVSIPVEPHRHKRPTYRLSFVARKVRFPHSKSLQLPGGVTSWLSATIKCAATSSKRANTFSLPRDHRLDAGAQAKHRESEAKAKGHTSAAQAKNSFVARIPPVLSAPSFVSSELFIGHTSFTVAWVSRL